MLKLSFALQKPPFSIRGAANLILETVKRGEDDVFNDDYSAKKMKTIVLRIYEAFGGHAQAFLRVSGAFGVAKAYEANILEDELKELRVFRAYEDGNGKDVEIKLDFHGFEVKTVKLVLGDVDGPGKE